MIPQKGQYIKCFLNNNLIIEGIVEFWSSAQATLKSTDGLSYSIIQNTSKDVSVIKIIIKNNEDVKEELIEKFEETYNLPSNNDLRVKTLAELKILLSKQDKKIISDKMRDHVGTINPKPYALPNIFKKDSK